MPTDKLKGAIARRSARRVTNLGDLRLSPVSGYKSQERDRAWFDKEVVRAANRNVHIDLRILQQRTKSFWKEKKHPKTFSTLQVRSHIHKVMEQIEERLLDDKPQKGQPVTPSESGSFEMVSNASR